MKYTWTEEDIVCGKIVCKPRNIKNPDLGWHSKWTYKIGYVKGSSTFNKKYGSGVVIIALSDGMVSGPMTQEEMAKYLTMENMMPMPHAWLLEVIDYLRDVY